MRLDYLETVSAVLHLMRQPDSGCQDTEAYRICYNMLFRHLLDKNLSFSMDTALDWLESRKDEISYGSYTDYRKALFRLEHYTLFGDINCAPCRSKEFFFCRSGMSESFYRLIFEMEERFYVEQNPCYYPNYSVAIKAFLRLATTLGVTEPEAITLDLIIAYWDEYCLKLESTRRRQNAVCAISSLMKYLHRRGDVPACYQMALPKENAEALKKLKLPQISTARQPSVALETKADEYLAALDEWKYKESSKAIYRMDMFWYFMFLELNHLEHSTDAVEAWASVLPDSPDGKQERYSTKERRIHTVRMFDDFMHGQMKGNILSERPKASDSLPEWSRNILDGFLESRRRDGMTVRTLDMCRAAGSNFFFYLEKKGIRSPGNITPEVVKEFHCQDYHSTPESKNAYSVKLRQLLRYMADIDLVPSALAFAVSTACAPVRNIVDTLSDEMIDGIYEFRRSASSPMELRDAAMVMLGLRMGIRGVDILNLRIDDFDWRNQTVSFIQRKNRKAITLPVPTDVGNSVYQYIRNGRPESADAGNGFIFVHHQAPYVPLKVTTACRGALKRILLARGFELEEGQGFHITRKTFATRMLRANNRLDDISSALGHARHETAETYLERDEERMRLCPLEFGGVLSYERNV